MSTELLPGFEAAGVLLSIRPVYATLIASGAKTVELRRRFPDVPAGSPLVVYATQPVSAIVCVARLRALSSSALPTLWRKFGTAAAVTKETFHVYFDECSRGIALELEQVSAFRRPIGLKELRGLWPAFSPPQSYRYVPDEILKRLRGRAMTPALELSA